jgi:hypothetical protein
VNEEDKRLALNTSIIIMGSVLVAAVVFGGYYVQAEKNMNTGDVLSVSSLPTSLASSPAAETQQYEDPQARFRFTYPMDYTLLAEQSGQSVRLTKQGPTQHDRTELSDGAVIVFEPRMLQDQSLEQWVAVNIQEKTSDGTIEIIEPARALTLNGKAGFTYSSRGLGSFQHYFFRSNDQSPMVLSITTVVSDPKNLGFQAEIDRIMASVEILK